MNVTFRGPSAEVEERMLAEAERRGMTNLRGHRSVGGVRASLYNAVTLPAVEKLAGFMDDYRRRHAR